MRRPDYGRRRKELRYLKETIPGYTTRPSNGEVREHIGHLLSYGWTIGRIAREADLHSSTVWDQYYERSAVHVDTAAAILSVKLTEQDIENGPGLTKEGRRLGAHRIITGLAASGWSHDSIANEGGFTRYSVRRYAQVPNDEAKSQISTERYLELRKAAARLEGRDPVAEGVPVSSVRQARSKARRRGYPPIACWDLETIHLAEATPEWTGACGTSEGYRIHIREGIPICDPCRNTYRVEKERVFSYEKFARAFIASGMSGQEMAQITGASTTAVYRWTRGERNPLPSSIRAIADALGVSVEDITDEGDAPTIPVVATGEFNRHALAVAIEQRGWNKNALGKAAGLSHTAISKWTTGASLPHKTSIQKVAEILGVDWKEFYS